MVLFALPGLYLLGFLRLEGIKPDDHLGVGRMLVAALFLIFSISLLPGLFGASLGNVEAFIPVQAKQTALLERRAGPAAPVWMKNQYKKRSPRPARKTSWCSSTSPAMPAPTATG